MINGNPDIEAAILFFGLQNYCTDLSTGKELRVACVDNNTVPEPQSGDWHVSAAPWFVHTTQNTPPWHTHIPVPHLCTHRLSFLYILSLCPSSKCKLHNLDQVSTDTKRRIPKCIRTRRPNIGTYTHHILKQRNITASNDRFTALHHIHDKIDLEFWLSLNTV